MIVYFLTLSLIAFHFSLRMEKRQNNRLTQYTYREYQKLETWISEDLFKGTVCVVSSDDLSRELNLLFRISNPLVKILEIYGEIDKRTRCRPMQPIFDPD